MDEKVARGPRYPMEEFERRGDAIYEGIISPKLKASDRGKFVAIDIETGEFEVDEDKLAACQRLRARIPDSQTWLVKVGSRYVVRFGGKDLGDKP